jgi:uncharacterized membrane protein YwzB
MAVIFVTGFHEAYWAKQPLLHGQLFRDFRGFTAILVISFVGAMLFYSLQAFFPEYLTLVYNGEDARQTGIDSIPFGAACIIGGVGSGILLPILGPKSGTTPFLVVAVFLQVIFIPLMSLPGPDDKSMALGFSFAGALGKYQRLPYVRVLTRLAGIGITELVTVLMVQLAAPDKWIGFATGALGLMRSMGGSAGTAIYTTIFQSKAHTIVPERVASAAVAAGLPQSSIPEFLSILMGSIGDITSVPGATPNIIAVAQLAAKNAYVESFKYVWLTSIAFGVVALICAVSTRDVSRSSSIVPPALTNR